MVGGAVRNALLGEPIGDIDIATTALPDEVIRRAEGRRLQGGADRHRARHRDGGGRRASRSRSRRCARTSRPSAAKPRSRFGRDWERDAERRDFTINALSVDADGTVHDYVGGLADLDARRVRFIGDAGAAHRRGLSAHPALLPLPCRLRRGRAGPRRACPPASPGAPALRQLSRERVRMEMLKLLVADGAAGARSPDGRRRAAAADLSAASPTPGRSPR